MNGSVAWLALEHDWLCSMAGSVAWLALEYGLCSMAVSVSIAGSVA